MAPYPLVILLPSSPSPDVTWSSAIRLRNGDAVFIADTVELAAVNNNLYVFQTQNLYYYDHSTASALFLTYLVPGHAPLGLAWQYVHASGGVELDGEGVLVHTATCVLQLWIKAPDFWINPRISLLAGNCYENTLARDGLPTFARFNQVQEVAMGCDAGGCATLILDSALRLCLLQGGALHSILVPPVQAISIWGTSTAAVAWSNNGFSVFEFSTFRNPPKWGTDQSWVALTLLDMSHVFALSSQGALCRFLTVSKRVDILGSTPFSPVSGLTHLAMDFPYGLYVTDVAHAAFYLASNLGCLCPPGYAVAQIESQHCQPAPPGGYVDVLGNFIACPPGTFGQLDLATARQSCLVCPPLTVSNQTQSTRCTLCSSGIPDPLHVGCVQECPAGTQKTPSGCVACPLRGQTFGPEPGACVSCPPGTYTDPEQGVYTCVPCPGPSPPCPLPTCNASAGAVVTITMLGVRPVDMAVVRSNGTVYIAAFSTLISVGHSGNALEVILPELALVRGISLGPNDSVLYAAVTQSSLLCIAFADSPSLLRRWYWIAPAGPRAVLVGVRFLDPQLVVWDAATNSVLGVPGTSSISFKPDADVVMALAASTSVGFLIMVRDRLAGNQSIWTHERVLLAQNQAPETAWNPYMAFWGQRLVVSSYNAILVVGEHTAWGVRNLTGRVDAEGAADARFTSPGPMAEAPQEHMLLVVDQLGLRLVYGGESCVCPASFFGISDHCMPCPSGWVSMFSSQTCTTCTYGQFTNPGNGACVPCARIRWWNEQQPCSPILDTMVGADASGLTLSDMIGELLPPEVTTLELLMRNRDYISLQTLVLPVPVDAVLLDAAANARFWLRAQRVTPPPEVYVLGQLLDLYLELELPGFWVACSDYVLQIETCSCELPSGGILLGNSDMSTLWNKVRAQAATLQYDTLLVTPPPDPDLFLSTGGYEEAIHFRTSFNISTSSMFVSRTDAGGGTDDDNPNVLFIEAVNAPMSISVPPTPTPTPSQSSFATCVAGWPATYVCPAGFLWVAPLFTCVPCKQGFYFSLAGACTPCPKGSFSALPASTACDACATSRTIGMSACNVSSSVTPQLSCPAGSEARPQCLPCLPGFSKSAAGVGNCLPCAPGTYSNALGRTGCLACPLPFVATQWGSSSCVPCALGAIPSPKADTCYLCLPRLQYFIMTRLNQPLCVNKTVLQCRSGFFLNDGGMSSDNQCVPCSPCAPGTLMVPFLLAPCSYVTTGSLGPPYRCVPLRSVAGQFSRLSVNKLDSSAFDVQYTPCQGLPPFATWAEGPSPSYCFFQCNFAVSGPARQQYLFYYSMEKQDAAAQSMLRQLEPNVYPLDYPGLAVDLMLGANSVCMPCPNTLCPVGKWRPVIDGCGPPVCDSTACQVMAAGPVQYDADGCIANCSRPPDSHWMGLAPLGMGDACPWECDFGFFMELVMIDLDTNETGFICLPCSPSACQKGTQEYHVGQCLPTSQRSAFCIQCPSSALALPVPGTVLGQCQYACIPNVSFQSSVDHECKLCPSVTCPAGFRLTCAEQPCIQCPPLPMQLWSSAVPMPSSTGVCQAACRDGFHTLDILTRAVLLPPSFSYDPGVIRCMPCSPRPTLPCPARSCPTGYFMQVPGSGLCNPCPTDYDCGLGQFPSSCICTQCPKPPPGQMSILSSQARLLSSLYNYYVPIRCPSVCSWNSMLLLSSCITCSSLNTLGLSFYAVWNASNDTRWWSSSQDPPHLPPRPLAGGPERRAGLCWPCPVGKLTLPGDVDLCLSTATVSIANQILAQDGVLFSSIQPKLSLPLRKLLGPSPAYEPPHLCPPFASGMFPQCQCNPGFIASNGTCVLEQRCCGLYRLAVSLHGGSSVRLLKHPLLQHACTGQHRDAHGHCSGSLGAPKPVTNLSSASLCPPGQEVVSKGGCRPCARGHYSPHHGMGPCLPCPLAMTTSGEGSLQRVQCVVPLDPDLPFVPVSAAV